jgi:hypothetical protein
MLLLVSVAASKKGFFSDAFSLCRASFNTVLERCRASLGHCVVLIA